MPCYPQWTMSVLPHNVGASVVRVYMKHAKVLKQGCTCYETKQSCLSATIRPHYCKSVTPREGCTDIGKQLSVAVMSPSYTF